jgi:hypothetical protein
MTLKWPSPRQPGEAGRDIAARIRLIIKMVSIIKSLGRGIGAVTTGVPPRWASVGVAAIGRPEFVNSDRLEDCESEVVSINGWPRVNLGRTPCAGTIILFNLSTGSFWSENSNFLPECN